MFTFLTDCATVADFTTLYGESEVMELSNLCDPLDDTIDNDKIQQGLDLATEQINSYYAVASDCGKALIKINCRMFALRIARYILDTTKSRPHVEDDYKMSIDQITNYCSCDKGRCPLSTEQLKDILGDEFKSSRARYRGFAGTGRRISRMRRRSLVDIESNNIGYDSVKDNFDLDQN